MSHALAAASFQVINDGNMAGHIMISTLQRLMDTALTTPSEAQPSFSTRFGAVFKHTERPNYLAIRTGIQFPCTRKFLST